MNRNAFTLIELLIVVAIIGILAAIAVPNFMNARMRATIARIQGDQQAVATAVEMYMTDNSAFPSPELASDDQGNLTTWPYYVPDKLVKPIAYLSDAKLYDPLGRPLDGLPRLVSRYRFKVFGTQTRDNLPGKNSAGAREAKKVLGEYMIVSHGPNRWLDLPKNFGDGANATDWFWLPYDASNGLLSPGDITRGQSGPVRGFPGYSIQWNAAQPRNPYD
ncbi:MAG: prepilin-type N-terminal cleavage/methylation domain-containing protein [bacterium]|nr:prepilin-type N-terminal cleavage/methylation domain-containing protein [bacterium]